MKNKFSRSVTAIMLTAALLISSQGVVTAFADDENYSDASEYSSVQTTEVKGNETPSSNESDAEPEQKKCTCGAVDDNTHDESCPLYVKPDGGNTDGDNTEDDAAQCTCGAEEGGPHQENCPLYVKPDGGNTNDGDTDNGAGEDTDIKSVVDAINALPAVEDLNEETNYEDLKALVASARTAYDALSEDQKATFDTAVLDKLTALEAKISELESGNQETESSEAVQNVIEKIDVAVEQIDYTTETIPATDGTTVTKTHIRMLKDLDPANNAEFKALIDKEAAHEQDENQSALTAEEAAKLSDARKVFEDAKAKYLSEGFSNAQLAARQAYDALATEEEKAQVTNYSLLTDMEVNIAYIMQAVNTLPTGSNPSDILGFTPNAGEYTYVSGESKWKAEPVDFSEPTTSGIEVDVSHVEEEGYIIYTIPEGFSASEININASKDIEEAFHGTYMPGDEGPFSIKLVNNSSKEYNYVENSFYVAPNPNPGSVYEESDPKYSASVNSSGELTIQPGWIDGAIGFDGSHMLVSNSKPKEGASAIIRTANSALQTLVKNFGEDGAKAKFSDDISYKYLNDEYLDNALKKAGYNGIDELNHYYIDYFNDRYNTSYSKLEDMEPNKVVSLFMGNRSYIRETNIEVQEFGYNFFYNYCFTVSTNEPIGEFSIVSWMNDKPIENTLRENLSSFASGSNYELPFIEYNLDGLFLNNAHANYDFGATFGLKLSSPTPPVDPEDPTPTPDPDPDPTPRPGTGGDEDDDTPTIINETPVPTTTIEDEDVPMADLPENTVTIDDEEVPLKDNPNTGDAFPVAAMAAAALSLGGVVALNRKKK